MSDFFLSTSHVINIFNVNILVFACDSFYIIGNILVNKVFFLQICYYFPLKDY